MEKVNGHLVMGNGTGRGDYLPGRATQPREYKKGIALPALVLKKGKIYLKHSTLRGAMVHGGAGANDGGEALSEGAPLTPFQRVGVGGRSIARTKQ